MSENLLEEYKAYYTTRAERFANNEKYPKSYEAEKKLSEIMNSCGELEEFKNKLGNNNELCAVALILDEFKIEKDFFEKHQEHVRKLAAERIMEKAVNIDNSLDLVGMVIEEMNKNSIEISMDEANRQLSWDWKSVDSVEIYENAEVPEKYKQDMLDNAADYRKSLNKSVVSLEENNQAWQTGWKLEPDKIMEYRHKRLLPYSDQHIMEQLLKYKSIVNR